MVTSLGLPWPDGFKLVETGLAVVIFLAFDVPLPMTSRSVESSSICIALVSGVGLGITLGAGACFGLAGVGERFITEFSIGSDDIISLCDDM